MPSDGRLAGKWLVGGKKAKATEKGENATENDDVAGGDRGHEED